MHDQEPEKLNHRESPLEMSPEAFRSAGHQLVEDLALFLEELPKGRVTGAPAVADLRALLGDVPLPRDGTDTTNCSVRSPDT